MQVYCVDGITIHKGELLDKFNRQQERLQGVANDTYVVQIEELLGRRQIGANKVYKELEDVLREFRVMGVEPVLGVDVVR